MSHRHRHRRSGSSESANSSSSSSSNRLNRNKKIKPECSVDFRKIQENVDYHKKNINRPVDTDVNGFYADCGEEENENQWSGDKKKEAKLGLLNLEAEHGLLESKATFCEAKASFSDEKDLVAARAEAKSVEAYLRYSSLEVGASGPNVAVEGSLGKNTGAFVRILIFF
jgi:hypothetical protein